MTNHFASHSVILLGECEGCKGEGIEVSLACGDPINEAFDTAQAYIAKAQGCRLQFCADVFSKAEEEKEIYDDHVTGYLNTGVVGCHYNS